MSGVGFARGGEEVKLARNEVEIALNAARSLQHRQDVQAWARHLEMLSHMLAHQIKVSEYVSQRIHAINMESLSGLHGPYRHLGFDAIDRARDREVIRREESARQVVYLTEQMRGYVLAILDAAEEGCISA